jgi:hypothetical protein
VPPNCSCCPHTCLQAAPICSTAAPCSCNQEEKET